MADQIIRPSSHTVLDMTVADAAQIYDGNSSTYGELQETVDCQLAIIRLDTMLTASGPEISPGMRTSVTLSAECDWSAGTLATDRAWVWTRPSSSEPWELIMNEAGLAGWGTAGSPSTIEEDVTDTIGTYVKAGWEVEIHFLLNNGSCSTTPLTPAA